MCYENVLIALNKAENVHRFLENKLISYDSKTNEESSHVQSITSKVISDSNNSKNQSGNVSNSSVSSNIQSLLALSKSCFITACDLSQKSISQLLSLRKDSYHRISVEKMKVLWEKSVDFVSRIEKLIGTSAYVMRQSLITQTKHFIDTLHEGYKGKLVNTLDNERWMHCDVSSERQNDIDRLVSGKAFITTSSISSTDTILSRNASSNNINSSTGDLNSANKKEARPAKIDEYNYNVTWSVLFLTEIILTYLDISLSFQLIASELISKIIELIRLFDHRTRQLVLGAQAIQSAARLKSISARHLGITAQSIGFLTALLPHIRTALLAQLSIKHHLMLTEFDRISHELLDHHSAIVSKFVSIVSDSLDSSSLKLRSVDWDRFQGQCEYFDEVLRNVTALHRVLVQLLPSEQLQDIFSRIFLLLNRKIPSHFEDIMPSTQTGKQRILDDVTHLVTTFSRLKQIDCKEITNILEENFRKRYTASISNSTSSSSIS